MYAGTGPTKALFFSAFLTLAQPPPQFLAFLPSFCQSATPAQNSYSIHFSFPKMCYYVRVAAGKRRQKGLQNGKTG